MIKLENIKVSFPEKTLFQDLNWEIPLGKRIGLVGYNGVGKTTLLKIIIGQHEPDEGHVILPKNHSFGYLSQDLTDLSDYLLKEYLEEKSGIVQLKKKIEKYQEMLTKTNVENAHFHKIAEKYEKYFHEFEIKGGYSFESRAKSIILGLGFKEKDWLQPCSSFSGGWKMRVVLAGLLLSLPDILLLDEPTNHLDSESLEWLEDWLLNYKGNLIVISHDHYFLDKVVEETVEVAGQNITIYNGNYSFYLTEREKQKEIKLKQQKHLIEEKEHLEKFIERFRYKATKATQVQSRVKTLEKLSPQNTQDLKNISKNINIRFINIPRSGREVVNLENINHGYENITVLKNIDLVINRGEKVALTGVNGAGKSTLLRIISGTEAPLKGKIKWGHNVKIAYFSQESSQNLNYENTVWDEISNNGHKLTDQEKRDLLGSFLFSGDEIYKLVKQLSGGEKSRLSLAKLLLEESNLLILDEPGNHLDINTKNIFHQALKKYNGTILIVSHDRFFLDQLADKVVEIKEGKINIYHGNYSYFAQKRKSFLAESHQMIDRDSKKNTDTKKSILDKKQRKFEAEQRNKKYQLMTVIEKELTPIEEQITSLEEKKINLEKKLCQIEIFKNPEKIKQSKIELHKITNKLDNLVEKWEELTIRKEEIKNTDFIKY